MPHGLQGAIPGMYPGHFGVRDKLIYGRRIKHASRPNGTFPESHSFNGIKLKESAFAGEHFPTVNARTLVRHSLCMRRLQRTQRVLNQSPRRGLLQRGKEKRSLAAMRRCLLPIFAMARVARGRVLFICGAFGLSRSRRFRA